MQEPITTPIPNAKPASDKLFKVSLIIIGLLIVIGLFGNIYLLTKKQIPLVAQPIPTPIFILPTSIPTSSETVYTEDTRSANWKTYTNEKYKFSFKYPSEYLLIEKGNVIYLKSPIVYQAQTKGLGPEIDTRQMDDFDLQIKVVNYPPTKSERDYLSEAGENLSFFENYQNGSLRGLIGRLYSADNPSITLVSQRNNQMLEFKLWGFETGNRPSERSAQILNLILSTFRFD